MAVETFFGLSAHHYVYDKKFSPFCTTALSLFNDYQTWQNRWRKSFVIQLRFSTFRAGANQCDIVVCRVFDDVPQNDLNKHNEQEAS